MSTDEGAPEDPPAPPDAEPAGAPDAEPEPPPAPTTATVDDLRLAVGVPLTHRGRQATGASERDLAQARDAADDRAAAKRRARDERARARDRARDEADEAAAPLDPEARARRRRLIVTLALSLVVGLAIVALVLFGRANASRLVFACGAEKITAEAGRSFPPWGTRALDGPELIAIAIPPQAECQSKETEDRAELEQWFLDALIEQAQAKLAAKEVTAVDDAEKQLQQALLLARTPERRDQRRDIERMLGDVGYWRGAARTKVAIDALADAAKLYDAAAVAKPRNVSDAAAWAEYARHVADELKAGPDALRDVHAAPATGSTRPTAPPGVALPIEPEVGEEDAGFGSGSSRPDAGVPTGGVLL